MLSKLNTTPTNFLFIIPESTEKLWSFNVCIFTVELLAMQDNNSTSTSNTNNAQYILNKAVLHWRTLWETRNEYIHEKAATKESNRKREIILLELEKIYDWRNEYLSIDQYFLLSSIQGHKNKSDPIIQNWIQRHNRTLKNSIQIAKKKELKGVKQIKECFTIK